MKRVLTVLTALMLLFSVISIGYCTDDSDSSQKVMNFNLQQAVDYALKHNRDILIQDLNVKKAELFYEKEMKRLDKYEVSKEDSEKMAFEPWKMSAQIMEEMKNDMGVTKRAIELNFQIAKWNKEIKQNEIKYNVEKAYYDVMQALKRVEIAKESLDLAKKQYEQSKKMFELGLLSNQELLEMECAVSQAQTSYTSAQMGYQFQKMNFNNILGLPLDQEIKLDQIIQYEKHDKIELQDSIEKALKNNALLKTVKEKVELTKLVFKAAEAVYPKNTYKYKEYEIGLEEAIKNLEMVEKGIEMEVRMAYIKLLTAEKQIKTCEMAVKKSEEALRLAMLGYEAGQKTPNDVTKARIELMRAKNDLASQIYNYNIALLDFKYSTGLGKRELQEIYLR
ncbi:Outer membrane protein TolC [Caloranaerobacter azorensis DSM 13643]|uniref:Outer membrane protein TolC n=1 Tax=Caloranaerobacter azorensis DSM 13643 TaxID=1121264 RepID=A0A1M5SLG5_9FIRM|nr:TolC family protein [Caloranaerobacter azorensis]SHH39088.1 Outer membrane protein TolC [Caloranaerobacter azorensis DSM 13643]